MNKDELEEYVSQIFGEEDFADKMETLVKAFLEKYAKDGYFESYDGKKIHYYQCIHPKEKAAIVISHGFCEFFDKYHEVVYELFQLGYSIFFIEHRGHGKSYRDIPEQPDLVYIDSYDQYLEDFKSFMDRIVTKESRTKRYYLFAHSMGGCIGGLFLEKYPSYFQRAILSSPMMQLNIGRVPYFAAKLLMSWAKLVKWEKKYAPGQHGYDGAYEFAESSTLSEARYRFTWQLREKYPEFRTFGGSYAWTKASLEATERVQKNAGKIKIPLLLFQAGQDSMVVPEGQDAFLSKIVGAQKKVFLESKHEIFNATQEIRREYYRDIAHFVG